MQAEGHHCSFETGVDVGWANLVGHPGSFEESAEGSVRVVRVGHDVGDSSGNGFDRARCESCAVVVDALAALTIFLIGDFQCGVGCRQELAPWSIVWNDGVVSSAQDDVFDTKSLRSCSPLGGCVGKFSNAQQKVKCHADEVPECLVLGVAAGEAVEDNVMRNGNGDSKLSCWRWVLTAEAFNLSG